MPLSYGQKKGILNVASQKDLAAFKRFMDAQGLDPNEVYEFGILVKNDMGDDADLVKLENEEGIDLEMGRLGDVVADLAKGNTGGRRRRTRKGGRRSRRTRKGGRRGSRKMRRTRGRH
jgi:hypothetical protein